MPTDKKFSTLVLGDLGNNCYLVPCAGILYIIDPADEAPVILEEAKKYTFKEAVILLTHAHVDHIQACGEVAKALKVKRVYLNERDHEMYSSPENHLLPYIPPAKDLPPVMAYEKNDDFTVLETPGHTPGGVCLLFPEFQAVFTGDTLFRGSIGRTDLPGGDYKALVKSIREKLLPLDEALQVYPGHMTSSSIGEEKASNPYLS